MLIFFNLPWDWHHDSAESVEQMQSSESGHEKKPEPEEEIHFLIDNVEWKHTETVELLLTRGSAYAVESAAEWKRNVLEMYLL